jgi:hypothetical protein
MVIAKRLASNREKVLSEQALTWLWHAWNERQRYEAQCRAEEDNTADARWKIRGP